MSSGNTFNFGGVQQTASGQGSVNQVGNNQATINNAGASAPTVEKVIDAIAKSVPEEEQAKLEEEVFGPLRAEIAEFSAMPIAQAEESKQTFVDRVTELVKPLAPHSQKIANALLTFGETGLSMIPAPAGWLVAATVAAIRALRA